MKRNPLVPFFLIMIIGVGLMFLFSINGVDNAKQMASEKEGGGAKQETPSNPEDIYKSTCIGCHGDQYQGGTGPSLKGVGDRLSKAEIKEVITKGRGGMPANMVPANNADKMAEWVSKIK
ncbi:cytochrome c550 [Priestia koreensis]|uniref:cytochrome c550 n=1 Tax=Priestia koreensis TaxID=284581 RepID=UPI001F56AA7C|nr:cytochrome c [Priestia koreensis]MCM3002515.1 cytochrome c [Priestia koreensis]UNL84227.1 cytochrome c [Priestia koreensis]